METHILFGNSRVLIISLVFFVNDLTLVTKSRQTEETGPPESTAGGTPQFPWRQASFPILRGAFAAQRSTCGMWRLFYTSEEKMGYVNPKSQTPAKWYQIRVRNHCFGGPRFSGDGIVDPTPTMAMSGHGEQFLWDELSGTWRRGVLHVLK